jgi:26S proteasome regulatory subunit T4
MTDAERKEQALQEYRKKLLQHKEIDAKVRTLREQVKQAKKEYDKTEEDLKALQSVGQIIAEVLRQLDEERCELASTSPAHSPACILLNDILGSL